MRHLLYLLLISSLIWSCSEKSSTPSPSPIPTPEIDMNDSESVEDAFAESNPTWTKKEGDMPESVGYPFVSIALYDTLQCFNGRETSIGFHDYQDEVPSGFYVRLVGSNSYYVVPVDENLRQGVGSARARRLVRANPLLIEPEANGHVSEDMYFLKAFIPAELKPGIMELEFKAYFPNGNVSDIMKGQIQVLQLGVGPATSAAMIMGNWKINKMLFNDPSLEIQELIFGSKQSLTTTLIAYCQDGSIQNILLEITYLYFGSINLSPNGTYHSVLDLKARTADFDDPNWDCGDPINYVDVREKEETTGSWGLSDDGQYLISIIDPYFDEDGYYYSQYTSYSKIIKNNGAQLTLREHYSYDPGMYTEMVLGR